MKELRKLIYLVLMLTFCISCAEEKLDSKSVIIDSNKVLSDFDNWLLKNYTYPYNIDLKYRLEDIETDYSFDVVPAKLSKSIQMSKVMKHLWFEAYDEVAGINFTRAYAPKVIHFIGSAEHDDGNIRLGSAEGGIKVTLTLVNDLNVKDLSKLNEYYFNTMHHEFAHILHQTVPYPPEFNLISAGDYLSESWINLEIEQYAPMGFVTAYSSKEFQEDFVEIISHYITWSDTEWAGWRAIAGIIGSKRMDRKISICKSYMKDIWKIDLDILRNVIQRRSTELKTMDLDSVN